VSARGLTTCLVSLSGVARTKLTGDTAEAVVLAEFVKMGFPVLLPFGEDHRYDMVIEAGGRFLKVQVKTASPCGWNGDRSCLRFHGYSHKFEGGKFRGREDYRGSADLFAAFAPSTGKVYVLPVDEVPETDVWLRLTAARNGQQSGIRMAEDHLLEKWAQQRIGLTHYRPGVGAAAISSWDRPRAALAAVSAALPMDTA
jgi:PD-(D/E)XK nuclease superfamily protein